MSDLLTPQEAEQVLPYTSNHIRELVRTGRLEARKDSRGRWQISRSAIKKFLAEYQPHQLPAVLDQPRELERLYRIAGSQDRLAAMVGCAELTLRKALQRHQIRVTSKADAASGPYVPEPVTLSRWMDVAIIFMQRGVKPPTMAEMCPPNCPGREWCLDGGECIQKQGRPAAQRRRS